MNMPARLQRLLFATAMALAAVAHAAGDPGMGRPQMQMFPPPARPMPSLDERGIEVQRLQALLSAAQHTAGAFGYEYRAAAYPDESSAGTASLSGLPKEVAVRTVGNLVEAAPQLRRALGELFVPGSRSRLVEVPLSNGNRGWAVVELVRRFPATVPLVPGPDFETWALRMVEWGLLPPPAQLLADPHARVQAALWRARNAQAIRALPAGINANTRFGDETTPLHQALLRRDFESAKALVEHGANVNSCVPAGCPLDIASLLMNAADFPRWRDYLLASGAKIDGIDLAYATTSDTLLTHAILRKDEALTTALLGLGASADGVPGVRMTPLQAAVLMGNKSLAEAMLAKGAEPLNFTDRGEVPPPASRYNIYRAAVENGDPQLAAWAEAVSIATARARPALGYKLHIEQGGKIVELSADGTYPLRAAPFSLVVRFNDAAQGSLHVGASTSAGWMQEVRRFDRRNAMFYPLASSAPAEPPKEDSYVLLTADACRPTVAADALCDGSFMTLRADSTRRADFHEVRPATNEYARQIRSILNVSAQGNSPATPLTALKGKTLYMVATNAINLGSVDGLRFISAHYLQLKFL